MAWHWVKVSKILSLIIFSSLQFALSTFKKFLGGFDFVDGVSKGVFFAFK